VVAASALQGKIALPDHLKNTFSASTLPQTTIHIDSSTNSASSSSSPQSYEILPKFPSDIRGRLIFCNANNLNTDGIYAGVHTYNDNITREQMGEYVMENYDPNFKNLVQKSDILVTGYNFGSGSSREQAATVFLSCGIDLVIAGSFSETYKRNAINNGLLVIECPELVSDLAEEFSSSVPSVKPGYNLHFDVAKGIINIYNGETLSKSYQLRGSIGKEVQKLYLTGGLENLLKQQAESTR
jgi:homoaconitate hydratase